MTTPNISDNTTTIYARTRSKRPKSIIIVIRKPPMRRKGNDSTPPDSVDTRGSLLDFQLEVHVQNDTTSSFNNLSARVSSTNGSFVVCETTSNLTITGGASGILVGTIKLHKLPAIDTKLDVEVSYLWNSAADWTTPEKQVATFQG